MEDLQIVETKQTYFIPAGLLGFLEKRIEKLNKRAEKIGCKPVKLVEHSRKKEVARDYRTAVADGDISYEEAPKVEYIEVSAEGEAPKIAGWTFNGTLDHHSLPGAVVVNTAPGCSIPTEFFKKAPVCEHCGKERIRKDTFVLQNENGYKQVGRNCLRDFLGYDPNHIVAYFSYINDLASSLEEEEKEFWGRSDRQEWYFNLEEVLKNTVAVIRTYGWVPRSSADLASGRFATAATVAEIMAPTNAYNRERVKKLREAIKFEPEKDEAETKAALEWLGTQEPNNEYMHNLIAIKNAGEVTMRLFGYACSIIAAYQRAMEKLILNKAQNKLSEYVGTVGEKIEATVVITRVTYVDSFYGAIRLHKMLDDKGRTLVWFASGNASMEDGKKYKIKGTVKEHSEYNTWKQTVLKRVNVLEELAYE